MKVMITKTNVIVTAQMGDLGNNGDIEGIRRHILTSPVPLAVTP